MTYVTWDLVDSMFLKKVASNTYLLGTNKAVIGVDPPQTLEQPYDCVLKTYEDKVPDQNAALFRAAVPDLGHIFHKT